LTILRIYTLRLQCGTVGTNPVTHEITNVELAQGVARKQGRSR